MKFRIFAGALLAFSLLAPAISAISAPAKFSQGALKVEQLSTKGPAVILIPGLASGPWTWADTAARLEKTHAVYLLTLPGFDGSKPQPGTTLAMLSADLGALIKSKKIRKPVLVGHSMGGTLSLIFATEHSDLIAGVIAVDGLPVFPGTEGMIGDRAPLGEGVRGQIAGQTPEQFAAYQQTYMQSVGTLDADIAKKLAGFSSRSDIGATADFAAQLLVLDLRPRLKDIKVPVVEISPFHAPDLAAMGVDEARKTAYYQMLLQGIDNLEVISISPARHFVMFDQPEKFAAALDQSLAKMLESPAK